MFIFVANNYTMSKKNLPKLADLHHNTELAFKNNELNTLLNQQPVQQWVKTHPFAKSVKYIPIDKVEFMLTRIFQHWRSEVLKTEQLFNSVAVTVRLHYKDPVSGEWSYHDGVGAVGIQTDKGATAGDLSAIKQNAVMLALPAAKSYAIKDAAEHLGSLFGRDINRKDVIGFQPAYQDDNRERERVIEFIKGSTLENFKSAVKSGKFKKYEDDDEIMEMISHK